MADYIHGSTREREIARLEKQARFVAPWWLPNFEAKAGMQVLDLGTGIGAMAAEIAARHPEVSITGLDRSAAQLAIARERHPVARYVQGDAANMPFPDASFDRVHASWLLEHVPAPMVVVREVARVLKPGGVAFFVEVDNATLRTTPHIPEVVQAMAVVDAAQVAAGGDPYVGRKLEALFAEADFAKVNSVTRTLNGSHEDAAFFRASVEEFAEIFESVDETLDAEHHPLLSAAASALRALPERAGTAIHYSPVLLRAER